MPVVWVAQTARCPGLLYVSLTPGRSGFDSGACAWWIAKSEGKLLEYAPSRRAATKYTEFLDCPLIDNVEGCRRCRCGPIGTSLYL